MNSEKVKEIKDALECCKQNEIEETCGYCLVCPASNWDYEKECMIDLFQKALTLINELESENKRLKTQLAQANAGIVNCSGCKPVELNAVKDFVEKLKNKLFEFFQDNEELDGKISVGVLYVDVIGVEAKDGTIISLGLIDKLLKGYEK